MSESEALTPGKHVWIGTKPATGGMCGVWLGDDHRPVFCQEDATVVECTLWEGRPDCPGFFYRCDKHRWKEHPR